MNESLSEMNEMKRMKSMNQIKCNEWNGME